MGPNQTAFLQPRTMTYTKPFPWTIGENIYDDGSISKIYKTAHTMERNKNTIENGQKTPTDVSPKRRHGTDVK